MELLKFPLAIAARIVLWLSMLVKRSDDIYIFGSWYGKKYADNSKALYTYTIKSGGRKCIWICNDKKIYNQLKSEKLPVAMKNSIAGIYYQLKAAVAFSCVGDLDFNRYLLGNCIHIELWHGVGGGKKIGLDDKGYLAEESKIRKKICRALEKVPLRKHYFVATSQEMKRIFQSAFQLDDEHIIMAGQARNDMFYDKNYCPKTISKKEFRNKKIILYMPTHRKQGKVNIDCGHLFDLKKIETFCEKNDCVFVIKKHFYHKSEKENLTQYNNIIDITNTEVDTNELLLIADILISDYSSVATDFLLLNRPILYYCYDLYDYMKEDRDLYWEYEKITPGIKATTFDELFDELKDIVEKKKDNYKENRIQVCNFFYDPQNQCMASPIVLDKVKVILDRKKR